MDWVENFWHRPHRHRHHGHVTVCGVASGACLPHDTAVAQTIADRLREAAEVQKEEPAT